MAHDQRELDAESRNYYVRTLTLLNESGIPFLVGGAYALAVHAGIVRHTKDLDVFVKPVDRDRLLATLACAGYRTDVTFPHWLAKAYCGAHFIDVIYCSGNGISVVDEDWFVHALPTEVFGVPVQLCPIEETIWSKAFVMERERFDGADVAHLLRARGEALDWHRLLRRFGPHWRVLLAHLVLFGFIYPAERGKIPVWVLRELSERLRAETEQPAPAERICRGPLLSREQYLVDLESGGYKDARLQPQGPLTPEDVIHWTAAIEKKK
ncbi:MAG: hypothetical protein IRY99_07145 [Isosphaeraceae bacterium]|nr:hypothetical protein [Isosphaeraceae bacterium]